MTNEELALEYQRTHKAETILNLWEQVRPFCMRIEGPYIRAGRLEHDDGEQEAFLACVNAANNYDSNRGLFLTCLHQYIYYELSAWFSKCRPTRLPSSAISSSNKYAHCVEYYNEHFGRNPSEKEAALFLHASAAAVCTMRVALMSRKSPVHPDSMTNEDGEPLGWNFLPSEPAKDYDGADREADREYLKRITSKALDKLPEAQRKELHRRYWEGLPASNQGTAAMALHKLKQDRKFCRRAREYYEEYFLPCRPSHSSETITDYHFSDLETQRMVEEILRRV